MASPKTPTSTSTSLGSGRVGLSIVPGARVLKSPLSDEKIWKRLKEAGFDEDSIKRRDKAALIAYIATLEAQIFDLQHHMGLLILEKKDLASKYEQIKSSYDAAEVAYRHSQAANFSSLADEKKREENLKKALGVEKECRASMEKALHEMRAESAESKVAAECKMAEACHVMEDAQKKIIDAEMKLHTAESLQVEASRFHRAAGRKLQEVQAREDDLRRRVSDFKTDCEAKEKEIALERQCLSERRDTLQQEHERLLDSQALLNQREEHMAGKSQELNRLEKDLEALKANIEKEQRNLNEEKVNLEITTASLSQRELAVIGREAELNKREQELLVFQEKLSSKESIEIQKVIADHEAVLRARKLMFEAELQIKRKSVEDEIDAKRRDWELREVDICQREFLVQEKEQELEGQLRMLAEKERDISEKTKFLDEKERSISVSVKDVELRRALLQQEKEETNKKKLELDKSLYSLEDQIKQVDCAKEKLEIMKNETNELSVLEIKLKEEVDIVRAQKLELLAEEERMKAEKAKFEAEWELIDEKREELQRAAECVAAEREVVSKFLKDQRESLRLEKEVMRDKYKNDMELLNHEREEFRKNMEQERSGWFSKIQQEHADFLLGIEMQKRELESSIEKRREEVESYLRDKEKTFDLERTKELDEISSLKEKAATEMELITLELKKLDAERKEINLDRERSEREWTVLNKSIQELKDQTLKLEKQRELLRTEREEICYQIEHLKRLENLKLDLDNIEVAEMQQSNMESSLRKLSAFRCSNNHGNGNVDVLNSPPVREPDVVASQNSACFSWIKRYTDLIFKSSPENLRLKNNNRPMVSDNGDSGLASAGNLGSSNGYCRQKLKSPGDFWGRQPTIFSPGNPNVICEVLVPGEIAQKTDNIASEIKEFAEEAIARSIPEQELLARKRRVENSSVNDFIDALPEQGQNNKKRRQEVDPGALNHCLTSSRAGVPEDGCASERAVEDIALMIEDEIVRVSEVTSEITTAEKFSSQDKKVCQQNAAYTHNFEDGGGNSHTNSRPLGGSVSPCSSREPEILDCVGEAGHGFEQSQLTTGLPNTIVNMDAPFAPLACS